MHFRCLACGHEFEDRVEQPRNSRQCSQCGRRRMIESSKYHAAVDQIRDLRRSQFDPQVSRETLASLIETLNPVALQNSLSSILRGELGEALDDPFIGAKALVDIWRDACRDDTDNGEQ